jgi:endonuclease YncB( thermonuclease family)
MKLSRRFLVFRALGVASLASLAVSALPADETNRPQQRPHSTRISVPVDRISVDDGDTIRIAWSSEDTETVRLLGIDTPETRHEEHALPFDQPFGREATAFVRGVLAMTQKAELIRAPMVDPYDRTLGYLYVNDRNLSVILLSAELAVETVSHYGDNGLPNEAAACLKAARQAGPVPFEPPYLFRKRMRQYSETTRGTPPPD